MLYRNKKTNEILNKKKALKFWCEKYNGNDSTNDIPFKEVFEEVEEYYICYETNQTMNKKDWFLYYLISEEIDKNEYKNFIDWWHDMRKSGVIEKA